VQVLLNIEHVHFEIVAMIPSGADLTISVEKAPNSPNECKHSMDDTYDVARVIPLLSLA